MTQMHFYLVQDNIQTLKFDQIQVPTMVYCITPATYSSNMTKNDQLKDFFGDFFWIMLLENQR